MHGSPDCAPTSTTTSVPERGLEAFVYVNPNAGTGSDERLQLEQVEANASGLISAFDSFEFDNY